MPELPEVEIVARRATAALAGRRISAVNVVGINALRSLDPPPSALEGSVLTAVRRRGKLMLLDTDGDFLLLLHLMTGGGMTWKGESSIRDRSLRLVLKWEDGSDPLRVRERGTRQAAWMRAIRRTDLEAGEVPELAKLGPEAWWPVGEAAALADREGGDPLVDALAGQRPDPAVVAQQLADALKTARPLHSILRDQRVLAGVGRSWSDEIVWAAERSPYQRGTDLSDAERLAFVHTIRGTLDEALTAYEAQVPEQPAEKLKKPLKVHGKVGEPCPRCGTRLRGVHFESHTIVYCPKDQTGGRALKDRRLSKLGIDDPVDED